MCDQKIASGDTARDKITESCPCPFETKGKKERICSKGMNLESTSIEIISKKPEIWAEKLVKEEEKRETKWENHVKQRSVSQGHVTKRMIPEKPAFLRKCRYDKPRDRTSMRQKIKKWKGNSLKKSRITIQWMRSQRRTLVSRGDQKWGFVSKRQMKEEKNNVPWPFPTTTTTIKEGKRSWWLWRLSPRPRKSKENEKMRVQRCDPTRNQVWEPYF